MEAARKIFSHKYLNTCICFRSDKKYNTDSFLIIGLITNKEVGDVVPKFLVEIVSMCESRDPFIILTSFSCLVEDTSWTKNQSVRT